MAGSKGKLKIGKYLVAFTISVLIALFVVGFYYFLPNVKILRSLESSSVNWRFAFKAFFTGYLPDSAGKITAPRSDIFDRIVIARIDDETIQANGGSFPFDRTVWANMINTLNDYPAARKPYMVFYDIFFADKSQNPKSDKALIDAFRNYKGLIGEDFILDLIKGEELVLKGSDEDVALQKNKIYFKYCMDYNTNNIQAMKRFEIEKPIKTLNYPIVTPVMSDIANSLSFLGAANMADEEQTFRVKPLVVSAKYKVGTNQLINKIYPSVVLSMVVKLLQSELTNVDFKPGQIIVRNALYNGKRTDFTIPVDDKWRLTINYKSSPSSGYVRSASFKDITKVALPKDSVVFVGMYSRKGTYDIWLSPMGDMFGVEHLAYAVGTILNRDFITSVPDWMNILFIFVISLLVGLFISGANKLSAVMGTLMLLVSVGLGFVLFFYNIRIMTFIPFITSILVLVAVQIYILLTEGREKKFIKSTFSSYLNPKLVDILIQNPDMLKLGGEDKDITVFFSGVKGLDHIAENLTPKQLIEYLNAYFSKMADIVMETSGTLDKYIGDAVMAFWNAPIDLPDHALKCCQAAVKMMEALDVFNQQQQEKGYKPITIHIGINTGRIIVGNVGSDQQKNYTAIGDSVNLASRLKGLNKFFHTNIVISEFTYELVKDSVIARELDLTKVKGKTKPVRIYELLDVTKPA